MSNVPAYTTFLFKLVYAILRYFILIHKPVKLWLQAFSPGRAILQKVVSVGSRFVDFTKVLKRLRIVIRHKSDYIG